MIKKDYQEPEFEQIEFELENILTGSNDVPAEEESGKEYWTGNF